MRILKVLHRTLFDSVPSIHQTRTRALAATVASLLNGAFLTVTALGRGLDSAARTKHNIKRVDRLASNLHLQRERLSLYRALCHQLCQHLSQPVILIDWGLYLKITFVMKERGVFPACAGMNHIT